MTDLRAPFPYFGGKSRIAADVWAALGDVQGYVEPFFGSGAVLFARPHKPGTETVNDKDGLLANVWRAIKHSPDETAAHADWPVNEADLHARHLWLVNARDDLTARLMADPEWHDPKAAGWWIWGACANIGGGWCSGDGPWRAVNGVLVNAGDAGRGINRQLPHLSAGQGINRKLPHISAGRGQFIGEWFAALSDRLSNVRVACGNWDRITGPSVTRAGGGVCGVFLDPPYDAARVDVYATEDRVSADVRAWCLANGTDPALRIVLAGYEGEHNALEQSGWRVKAWKARGGYGSQGNGRGRDNADKERLWLSPHCLESGRDLLSLCD